jgi:hypothetical protein
MRGWWQSPHSHDSCNRAMYGEGSASVVRGCGCGLRLGEESAAPRGKGMLGRRSPRFTLYMEEYWAGWIGPLWAMAVMGCNQGPSGERRRGGGECSHPLLT